MCSDLAKYLSGQLKMRECLDFLDHVKECQSCFQARKVNSRRATDQAFLDLLSNSPLGEEQVAVRVLYERDGEMRVLGCTYAEAYANFEPGNFMRFGDRIMLVLEHAYRNQGSHSPRLGALLVKEVQLQPNMRQIWA